MSLSEQISNWWNTPTNHFFSRLCISPLFIKDLLTRDFNLPKLAGSFLSFGTIMGSLIVDVAPSILNSSDITDVSLRGVYKAQRYDVEISTLFDSMCSFDRNFECREPTLLPGLAALVFPIYTISLPMIPNREVSIEIAESEQKFSIPFHHSEENDLVYRCMYISTSMANLSGNSKSTSFYPLIVEGNVDSIGDDLTEYLVNDCRQFYGAFGK